MSHTPEGLQSYMRDERERCFPRHGNSEIVGVSPWGCRYEGRRVYLVEGFFKTKRANLGPQVADLKYHGKFPMTPKKAGTRK